MKPRNPLFRRYLIVLVSLACGVLFAAAACMVFFSYQASRDTLLAVQRAQAEAAAGRIGQRLAEIVRQIRLTAPLKPGADPLAQRAGEVRLLRQLSAMTDVLLLDRQGRERLRISGDGQEAEGRNTDFARSAAFQEARSGAPYFSPVYFRDDAQPYMTIAAAVGPETAGVTVAEVSLQFLDDELGRAAQPGMYVVDAQGTLIARSVPALAPRKTDLSSLPQVRAALASAEPSPDARDPQGQPVLSSYGVVAPLGWRVLAEQPRAQAFAAMAAVSRIGWLLAAGLALALPLAAILAWRLARPVDALHEAIVRAEKTALDRIELHAGGEMQALADGFNRIAARLRESGAEALAARRQYERERRSLLDMIEALPLAVFELRIAQDGQCICAFVSENVRTLLGVNAQQIMADVQECWRTTLHEDREVIIPVLQRALAARQSADFHHRVQFGGHTRWLRCCVAAPRQDGDGWRWTGFWIDSSQARRREEDLRAAKEAVESSARARSAFLANVSHEIRAPLNAVIGLSHLALKADLPPPQRDCLDKIHQAGTVLCDMTNDILDLARIDAGKFVLEATGFMPARLMENLAMAHCAAAADKGVALAVDVPSNMPHLLVGDPLRLEQVLTSLVEHALAAAECAEIAVRVERLYTADTQVMLKFSVRHGGAMPAAQDQQLFQPDGQSGAGKLRLILCKCLVELMGGSMAAESLPGAGSSISFTARLGLGKEFAPVVPDAAPASAPAPAPPPLKYGGARSLSKETFQQLVGYLSSGDRMAIDCFATHRDELLPALQQHAAPVEQAINRLDFDTALSLLDRVMTRLDIAFQR